jgi:hypothetical protein
MWRCNHVREAAEHKIQARYRPCRCALITWRCSAVLVATSAAALASPTAACKAASSDCRLVMDASRARSCERSASDDASPSDAASCKRGSRESVNPDEMHNAFCQVIEPRCASAIWL